MSTRAIKMLSSLSLAGLLLGLPVPAVAGDLTAVEAASEPYLDAAPASGFGLHLAESFALGRPALGLEGAAGDLASEGSRVSALLLPGSRDVQPLAKAAAEQELAAQAAPQKRGFGRWLKRHWYVPVLAAVAIGVAVGSSGSDSDSPGEED